MHKNFNTCDSLKEFILSDKKFLSSNNISFLLSSYLENLNQYFNTVNILINDKKIAPSIIICSLTPHLDKILKFNDTQKFLTTIFELAKEEYDKLPNCAAGKDFTALPAYTNSVTNFCNQLHELDSTFCDTIIKLLGTKIVNEKNMGRHLYLS